MSKDEYESLVKEFEGRYDMLTAAVKKVSGTLQKLPRHWGDYVESDGRPREPTWHSAEDIKQLVGAVEGAWRDLTRAHGIYFAHHETLLANSSPVESPDRVRLRVANEASERCGVC